jgi:hypothetical protein
MLSEGFAGLLATVCGLARQSQQANVMLFERERFDHALEPLLCGWAQVLRCLRCNRWLANGHSMTPKI